MTRDHERQGVSSWAWRGNVREPGVSAAGIVSPLAHLTVGTMHPGWLSMTAEQESAEYSMSALS